MFRLEFPKEDLTLLQLYDFAIFGVRKPREPREGEPPRKERPPREPREESPDRPPRERADVISRMRQMGEGDTLRKVFAAFWKIVGKDFKGTASYDGGKIFYTSPNKIADIEGASGITVEVTVEGDGGKTHTFRVEAKHKLTISTKMMDDFYQNCKKMSGTNEIVGVSLASFCNFVYPCMLYIYTSHVHITLRRRWRGATPVDHGV
jgi:hypothetical protein